MGSNQNKRRKHNASMGNDTTHQYKLLEIISNMTGSMELSEVLQHVAHHSQDILNTQDCIIFGLARDQHYLTPLISLDTGCDS